MIIKSRVMAELERLLQDSSDPIPRSVVRTVLEPFLKSESEPVAPADSASPELNEKPGTVGAVEELDAVLRKFKEKRQAAP